MGKQLTAELVFSKCKCDNLVSIKNLNLWGNDIDDMKLLRSIPNVEVLSLSVNKISSLKDFQQCTKLQELYLRKNVISDIKEIKYLANLKNLKVLWLWDNPCSEIQNYREIVIKVLPNLIKLDNSPITQEERQNAANLVLNWTNNENKERDIMIMQQQQQLLDQKDESNKKMQEQQQLLISQQQQQQQQQIQQQQIQLQENINILNQKKVTQQPIIKKNNSFIQENVNKQQSFHENSTMNSNILSAIISLLKELDQNGLEFVKKEVEKKLIKDQNL